MKRRKKFIWITVIVLLLIAFGIFTVFHFSEYRRNTRMLKEILKNTVENENSQGRVEDLITIDFDTLYVFGPYQSLEYMERTLGFSSKKLEISTSESCLNYVFVKDEEITTYFIGLPENLGFCINLKPGTYGKEELDAMYYEVVTRTIGGSSENASNYQDFNFYFKDIIPAFKETAIVKTNHMIVPIPVGDEIDIDIDGGEMETVLYNVVPNEDSYVVEQFTINGKNYAEQLERMGVHISNPHLSSYYIIDLATDDEYKEIAILDDGENTEPTTHFFKFQNNKLIYLGEISDFPENDTCHFQNEGERQGEVIAAFRLDILQTWYAEGFWKLYNNKLEFQPQSMYYLNNHYEAELLSDLLIYKEADKKSVQSTMNPGTVFFTATDNKSWVQIEDKSGNQGWFYVEDYDTIADTGKKAEEVFSGLFIAD